jgi:hypothetical protein
VSSRKVHQLACGLALRRYISGSDVALVMLLEDVLGPFWVYLRFGDVPSAWTFAGGALLLATLATHECVSSGEGRPLPTLEASPLPAQARDGEFDGTSKARVSLRTDEIHSQGGDHPYHSI